MNTIDAGVWRILRALKHRNYRLFFFGQSISLIGTWMQGIAMSWLVYRLTGSALLLGVVGFSGQIPMLAVAPFAGVLADRWNRHRMVIATQTLALIQALTLAVLALSGLIHLWHIIALSAFMGLVMAVDMPTRQAFVVEMVEEKEDLGNAIALNSSLFNGARLIGPSIAGLVIARWGEGICFLANGVSYVAVIGALLAMRVPRRVRDHQNGRVLHELKEGFAYSFSFPPVRSILLLLMLVSLVGMPYMILMPIMATRVLHGGPHTFGFLAASAGVGASVGAIYLAARRSVAGLGKVIVFASSMFGAALIGFSASRLVWLSLLLVAFAGLGMIVQMASSNTVVQTIVDDDKRGRVMSWYTMAFVGTAPFGSLLAGALASRMGAPYTIMIGGLCVILGSMVFASRLPGLRRATRPHPPSAGPGGRARIIAQPAIGQPTTAKIVVSSEEGNP